MLLKQSQVDALYDAFRRAQPGVSIRRAPYEHGGSPVLETEVYPIREVWLKGRIFSMASFCNSIIKAAVIEGGQLVERVGEIIDLWEHYQPTSPNVSVSNTFALVRWYKASPIFAPRSVRLWSEDLYIFCLFSAGLDIYIAGSSDLDVEIHLPNEYLDREAIIPVGDIRCHCARMNAVLDGCSVWLTIGLERVSFIASIQFTAVSHYTTQE